MLPPPMYRTQEEAMMDGGQTFHAFGSSGGAESGQKHDEGDSMTRHPGERLAASYANFYIAGSGMTPSESETGSSALGSAGSSSGSGGGGIICPAFGCPESDAQAQKVLSECFPGRQVVMVQMGREIVLGGGNVHGITQQRPLVTSKQGA